jgi:PhzF family phenazine biosynthesis protein
MVTMATSLTWVDAFIDTLRGAAAPDPSFSGNPAAVCLPAEPLPEARMQSLAFELGISETAYVTPTPGADGTTFDLRWFSPAVEIDLCGHATLASAHVLRQRGVVDGSAPVTFHTRSGALRAAFDGEEIELDFPADPFAPGPLPAALEDQWHTDEVVVSGATGFFTVVVLSDPAGVRDYRPDLTALAAAGTKGVLITAAAEPGSGADYELRVFGPNVGIDEDPATGSAQCAVGPYWATQLGRATLVAHQASGRGAVLRVRPDGDRVRIAGRATTVFSGDLC